MGYGDCCPVIRDNKYAFYVAMLMMLLFMSNQLGRYVLIATNVEMAEDIHFGDKACNVSNVTAVEYFIDTHHLNISIEDFCNNSTRCEDQKYTDYCGWQYFGTGVQYQLLAGPLFTVVFSIVGVPVSLVMERTTINRKNVIAGCAFLWSAAIILTGFSQQYWHLVVTRLGLAIFEAPFTSFAASIISSYCIQSIRGLAIAIFIWGVYAGLSVAFCLDMVVDLLGWRWAYWIAGIPGIVLSAITLCTVKEPPREIADHPHSDNIQIQAKTDDVPQQPFCSALYVVLLCTFSLRCGGGYIFNYDINNYFHRYYPGYPYDHFMSWIPLAMGSIATLLGGTISDRAAERRGYYGRLIFYCVTVLVTIPLSVGVLYLDPPWCFVILMPNYAIIETFGSLGMVTVVEQAPRGKHTSTLAVYVFSINIIGGNLNLLVPPMNTLIGLRETFLILYPGVYLLSFIFAVVSLPLAKKRLKRQQLEEYCKEDETKPLIT